MERMCWGRGKERNFKFFYLKFCFDPFILSFFVFNRMLYKISIVQLHIMKSRLKVVIQRQHHPLCLVIIEDH